VVIRMAMARATHLAWTNGRVQIQISNGIKESISVPILDAKALDLEMRGGLTWAGVLVKRKAVQTK